jgi:hypothetical protein
MGFPTRILRSALGPKFLDTAPVENPETDIGARQFNLAFHQVAGLNLVAPRVSLVAHYTGGQFVIQHQQEAWNTEGAQARPVLARSAAGVYTYTFASSYLDEDGVSVATVLRAPRISCHKVLTAFADRIDPLSWVDGGSPLVLQIRLWNQSGAGVDEPFWLEAL